jgi:hypothetical protein
LELNPETLDQARLLLHALITEPDENGVYSLIFKMHSEEYAITFLRDELVMLSPSIAKPSCDIQFIFKCNAISFHPRGTPQWYALCFHEVHGTLKTPKLLIAGDNECARRLLLYSLPLVEVDGELEFPHQL